MEEQTKELSDYLIAVRKRKVPIMIIIGVVFLLTVAVALLLPPKYKSSSTILIEQQEIPVELVMSTVTSYAAQQIQTIQARVMTRTNLLKMIDKFNLYSDEKKVVTTEELVAGMQDDIRLDIISADVVDPRTGRPTAATIAFSLSYMSEFPGKAQKVANELTSLYLSENITRRTQKASDTSIFFQSEINRLNKVIDGLDSKLAEFKRENSKSLPEVRALNIQLLQSKESELTGLDVKLDVLNERRFYLDGQLKQMSRSGSNVAGSAERLEALEVAYASAKSKYTSEHPDVLRLKNEVETLRKETGAVSAESTADELKRLRAELIEKQQKYTKEHPDVIALNEKISSLSNELNNSATRAEDDYFERQPSNPAYIALQAQLAGIDSEIRSNSSQRIKINEKIVELQDSLYKAPQVEVEYASLTRDYENAVTSFQEAKAKKVLADAAMKLESESKGERFTLIEPATLPEKPVSPNRPAIIFLGFILSIGCGIGFAFVADAISGTVRGATSLQRLLGVMPLVVVPYEMNLADITKKKRVKKRVVLLTVIVIIVGFSVVHFFISPLDVLWFRVLRKLDVLTA